MDTCIVEKCQINMTVHWSGKVAEVSLRVFDISYWTCAVLMMIFGIPLNVGIINYEWYGGDPQKRSLSNRMISSCVIAHCIAGVNLHTFAGFMRYLSRRHTLSGDKVSTKRVQTFFKHQHISQNFPNQVLCWM